MINSVNCLEIIHVDFNQVSFDPPWPFGPTPKKYSVQKIFVKDSNMLTLHNKLEGFGSCPLKSTTFIRDILTLCLACKHFFWGWSSSGHLALQKESFQMHERVAGKFPEYFVN